MVGVQKESLLLMVLVFGEPYDKAGQPFQNPFSSRLVLVIELIFASCVVWWLYSLGGIFVTITWIFWWLSYSARRVSPIEIFGSPFGGKI